MPGGVSFTPSRRVPAQVPERFVDDGDEPVIRCLPQGICSWDFDLTSEGRQATLEVNWMSEEGAIIADGTQFQVRKHGMFSGRWSLDQNGQAAAVAQKRSAFMRTFDITDAMGACVLRAESAFGRGFRLEREGKVIATVIPDHAFTRRTTIEICDPQWMFSTVSFSFWLVGLIWRRAQRNNNAAQS